MSAVGRRPVVTVAIVSYNSAEVLPGCLESLAAAAGSISYEVVVADNASSDESVEVAHRHHARVVEMGANRGYAAGVNAAVAAGSGGRAVLVLNPDVRMAPGSLAPLLAAVGRPGVGIAVPCLVDEEGRLLPSLRREPSIGRALGEALLGGHRAGRFAALGEMVVHPAAYQRPGSADWATGAALLVSRECLEATGPWDESFFLYSEETDFALRAREMGFGVRYVPEATAVHLGGESNVSPRLWSILTLNRVRLYRRRHGRGATAAFAAAVVLNEALRAAAGSPTHRAALRALLRARPGAPVDTAEPTSLGRRSRQDGTVGGSGYVCFSAQDWWYHNRAHSDFQLMRRLARHRPVLFVNSIGMRMPLPGRSPGSLRRLARKAASMARGLRQPVADLPGFHVLTPVLFPFYGIPWARQVNARLVRAQVARAARRLGIAEPDVVVTIPTAWEVVEGLPHRSLVYNRSDKHSAFTEADGDSIRALEAELLRAAGRVVYASRSLLAEEAPQSGGKAVLLDHGVDLDIFRPGREEPADLRAIPHPRIGFFGGLDDYIVDFELLEEVARSIPEASMVLVGDATCPMDRLLARPNVHWLGFRPYEEIPRYGAGFDVALMPWLDNDWIRSSNPIKLKEYLALGLPVVSTDFPEAHRYEPWVAIASGPADFVARVRKALADDDPAAPARRRAAVAGDSWDRRAAELMALCEQAAGA